MNEVRKKIIIQELHYWKHSRMLPEQYCDYLLAMYSEGEDTQQQDGKSAGITARMMIPYLSVAIIILLTLFLNYFTQLPYRMQISLSIISILTLLWASFFFSKRFYHYHIPLIGAAFLFLLATVQAVEHFVPGQTIILYLCLLCHSGMWIYTGKRLSIASFSAAGFLGAGVIIYFIVKLYNIF
ncbi:hypothetical protein ELQ35_12700 [Peribacillus cavernae]|uniref:DUF2157 domain-containing protein n=1 Tax=Peribacillus cavernae TaxID=1674310 RepID=A0A3S0U053_9BACI|nr:hypothetical protein [Peribacillus cavernae]MDQ0218278.1 hypothetical protein [Peribacillus cavernae]RUQ28437.1 hypothetical protein ELQ35_12700 [Peribacillus cavernae]